MKEKFKLNLQLFAGEGSGAGAGTGDGSGGDGATTGENATAAAEQRLRELGVPEDKIRKRASKVASKMPAQAVKTQPVAQTEETKEESASPTETHTEETKTPARMSWDEIMKDPEYNAKMQETMRNRLKTAKNAEDNLTKLTPAIELLARKYKLDPTNLDYEALNKAINDDDEYYENLAIEMGVSTETAKEFDSLKRESERAKAEAKRQKEEAETTLRDQMLRQHWESLQKQSEQMTKIFPNFNLQKELENPIFARMTAPGKGVMSVEDAYRAVHRKEIESASMQIVAQKTAEKISNNLQAANRRPEEAGMSSQAPSVTTFNYRNASPAQRAEFKANLRKQWANGGKVYPGQIK